MYASEKTLSANLKPQGREIEAYIHMYINLNHNY